MNILKLIEKLKNKWNIKSDLDFTLIMIVFSIAGMAIIVERPWIFHHLGIDHMPMWFKVAIYIPLIVPIYQVNLLVFGFMTGQFGFFWDKEKRLFRLLASALQRGK